RRDNGAHGRPAGVDEQLGAGHAHDRPGTALGGGGGGRGSHPRQPPDQRLRGAKQRHGGDVARRHARGLPQLALRGRYDQSLAPGAVVQVQDAAEQMAPGQHGDVHLMSHVTRRGFTLIELLVALVILGFVSAAIYKVLVTNQQTYVAQTQRIDLQQNIRAAATILPAEFREMNAVGAGTCADPNGNHPAWVLSLQRQWIAGSQLNVDGAITSGSPVRGFTNVTYSLWQSPTDNQYYLAQAVGTNAPQPMVGPLSGPNGLTFNYFNAAGAVTADSTQVAQIEIRVRGRTQSKIRQAGAAGVTYKIDSVVTRVMLRGNTRCGPCL